MDIAEHIKLLPGDCMDVLATLPDNSIDSCVTDPPYHLTSIVKRFGSPDAAPARPFGKSTMQDKTWVDPQAKQFVRLTKGFMGKQWDGGAIAQSVDLWRQVYRVLKPGAHLVAFGGTRTYHRMACAIEDAGFEIRDCIQWLYGSGFPKSHDVSKGIDRAAGAERDIVYQAKRTGKDSGTYGEFAGDNFVTTPATDAARQWEGWGTALKPSVEPLVLAQKPLANEQYIDLIGSKLVQLWSRLWLMLSAKDAAKFSALSPSVCGADAHDFAQWNAADISNIRAALCAQMGTSQFESALITSLSTASSWAVIWAEGFELQNTSITETEIKAITDLKTLSYLVSQITPDSIIRAHSNQKDGPASVFSAENYFGAIVKRLRGTLELSALAPAFAKVVGNCRDAGVSPNCEPIVLARKPLSEKTVAANVLRWGTGALNIDGCRVEGVAQSGAGSTGFGSRDDNYELGTGRQYQTNGRWPANVIHDGSEEVLAGFPATQSGGGNKANQQPLARDSQVIPTKDTGQIWDCDTGSAARFFYQVKQDEPCEQNASDVERCLLRCHRQNGDIVPLIAPTQDELKIVQNVKSAASLCNSCAIDIARVLAAPRQAQSAVSLQFRDIIGERNAQILSQCLALYVEGREGTDTILTIQNLKQLFGSVFHAIGTYTEASDCDDRTAPNESKRFWYTSKADQDDRVGSKHPTVKPLDLMQYLVRLVTPKGGTVLDMFAGSGTTGEAAFREGMKAVLIEREAEYLKDIQRRMELCMAGPVERQHASIKAKLEGKPRDDGPLFGGTDWDSMWRAPFDKPELL